MSVVEEGLERLGVAAAPESRRQLDALWQRVLAAPKAHRRLELLAPRLQALRLFFLAAVKGETPELAALSLGAIFEAFAREEELPEQMKATIAATRETLAELGDSPQQLQPLVVEFGHFRLVYLSLCALCQKFGLRAALKERAWLCLLLVCGPGADQRLDCLIETIAALLWLQQRGEGEELADFLDQFEQNTHYRVDADDLHRRCAEVLAAVPDFLDCDFAGERYERLYKAGVGPRGINYLCFLKDDRSAPATPLHATPLKVIGQPNSVIRRAGVLRPSLAFCRLPLADEGVQLSALPSPDTRLLSPLVKREIDSLDYFKNHSEMLEWVKSIVRGVELVRCELEDGQSVHISAHFQQFIQISDIRHNFLNIARLLRRINVADAELFTKFYFKILELLIDRELRERQDGIKSVLNDQAFMLALFAFCYELRLFVQQPTHAGRLLDSSRAYIESVFDFYKVLLSFTQIAYKDVPRLIKAHIYRLEYAVLLQEIWRRPAARQEYIPRRLYRCQEELCAVVLGKIRNFTAERLFLLAHALQLADEFKDRVWETFDLLLAAGMDRHDPERLYAFKFDLHLDTLLLAVVCEWRTRQAWPFGDEELLAAYADKVLFPFAGVREELAAFTARHREIVGAMVATVAATAPSRRWELNSTPIFGGARDKRQRVSLGLTDSLNINLEKRPYTECSASRSPPGGPQILTQQTEARNVFNLSFKKVKTCDIACVVPASELAAEADPPESACTPNFGD